MKRLARIATKNEVLLIEAAFTILFLALVGTVIYLGSALNNPIQ